MAKNFYAVLIRWNNAPTDAKITEIDEALGTTSDWLRFGGHNWILWTESSAVQIYASLAAKLSQNDSELVLKFDPYDYSGWAPKWVDDWIVQRRDGALRLINPPAPPSLSSFFSLDPKS
jgi:hypothetical protein